MGIPKLLLPWQETNKTLVKPLLKHSSGIKANLIIYWINFWLVRGDTDIISTSWSPPGRTHSCLTIRLVARLALRVEIVVKNNYNSSSGAIHGVWFIIMQLMMSSHTTDNKMNLLKAKVGNVQLPKRMSKQQLSCPAKTWRPLTPNLATPVFLRLVTTHRWHVI